MDNQENIIQQDYGTKQRKVAIVISEIPDGAEFEVQVMTQPDIWVSSTKITDAEFEENRSLLLIANMMLTQLHTKVTELKNE
ncbi:MAG: hypothetical protein IJY46_07625 [Lentisphaeria bacterium]|nr:hypothetical protein [Lentisphaeria bacterium]